MSGEPPFKKVHMVGSEIFEYPTFSVEKGTRFVSIAFSILVVIWSVFFSHKLFLFTHTNNFAVSIYVQHYIIKVIIIGYEASL